MIRLPRFSRERQGNWSDGGDKRYIEVIRRRLYGFKSPADVLRRVNLHSKTLMYFNLSEEDKNAIFDEFLEQEKTIHPEYFISYSWTDTDKDIIRLSDERKKAVIEALERLALQDG